VSFDQSLPPATASLHSVISEKLLSSDVMSAALWFMNGDMAAP
jgi:hypothetical protein